MAATTRGTAAALENELVCHGHRFSFLQAMRLLRRLLAESADGATTGRILVRSALTLAFPCSDVIGIDKTSNGYRMTVSFLGLYGQASPLPTFYTEELLDDSSADRSSSRGFLDLLNSRLYLLLHQIAEKYRLFYHGLDQARSLELLFCLVGLGEPALRPESSARSDLLRLSGLLALGCRSATGLAAFLREILQVPVRIVQCVERRMPVPADQQLRLGRSCCRLGVDAVVGSHLLDRGGLYRVQLGPLDREQFSALLPGMPGRTKLEELLRLYVKAPLVREIELILAAACVPAATLGKPAGARLGWDSWLAPDGSNADVSVFFP